VITLTELQAKEVILINDGTRLGAVEDLEIDEETGKVIAIIVLVKDKGNGLFAKADEWMIRWNEIIKIGSDVILVTKPKNHHLTSLSDTEKK
jgi:YlmC/YmxH family sporulation protein